MNADEYAAAVEARSKAEEKTVADQRASSGNTTTADSVEERIKALAEQPGGPGRTFVDECAHAGDKGAGRVFNYLQKGKVIHVAEMNEWFAWDGVRWEQLYPWGIAEKVEAVAQAYAARRDIVFKMRLDVHDDQAALKRIDRIVAELDRAITKLHNSKGPDNCLKFCLADESRLVVSVEELDADPYVLVAKNGVIQLRSGQLRPGRQEDFCTKMCPTEWTGIDTPCPKWEAMVFQILGESWDTYEYFHRLMGMAICGVVSEKNFPLLFGPEGDSGKTTIFEILYEVIRDYASPMPVELLLDQGTPQNPNAPTPAIMGLRGQRLCWASEPGDNRRFSVERIKLMSGGDSLMGRYPYDKKAIIFSPTHTLFMLSNHEPHAGSNDSAFWKRLRKIDCPFEFVDKPKPGTQQRQVNRHLKREILETEASGVLAWLVRGFQKYEATGVVPPKSVIEATERYREQEDRVLQFRHECIVDNPGHNIKGQVMYDVFTQWFIRNHGRKVPSVTVFGKMAARSFTKQRGKTVAYTDVSFIRSAVKDYHLPTAIPDEYMVDILDDNASDFAGFDDVPY